MTVDPALLPLLHLESLYRLDDNKCLLAINQWDGGEVPRLHLVRSTDSVIWRLRYDLSDNLATDLDELCRAEPPATDLHGPPRFAADYQRLLSSDQSIAALWQGPVFSVPASLTWPHHGHQIVNIDHGNAELLTPLMSDWLPDVPHRAPFLAAVVDRQAVAVCASVRITVQAHQAGVEVHPDFRRHGFGSSVVTAWAQAVRAGGAVPLYSTSWENQASQALAAGLGFEPFAVDYHVR